jgi:hypothetical protein
MLIPKQSGTRPELRGAPRLESLARGLRLHAVLASPGE